MRLSSLAGTCALLTAACGGGGGGGTDAPVVATIALSPGVIDTLFSRGLTVRLIVQAKDAGGNIIGNPSLSFSSGNQGIATVSPAGVITAQGTGKTTITVASGSASQSVEVVVRRKVASITVTPSTRTMAPSQTQLLTVRAFDGLNNEITGAATPTFGSSSDASATVDASGTVTAVAIGSATITATVTTVDGTRTATSVITVNIQTFPNTADVTISNNSFTPSTVEIALNGSVTWNNTANASHNVTFATLAGHDIPTHIAGSNTRTFATAGAFAYECTIHGSAMSGTIIVH
jgi:plastocyanin